MLPATETEDEWMGDAADHLKGSVASPDFSNYQVHRGGESVKLVVRSKA
jgi:hypothetical protein